MKCGTIFSGSALHVERVRCITGFLFFVVSGEISVNSPVNVDELLSQIVDLVAEQQKHVLWELDLP